MVVIVGTTIPYLGINITFKIYFTIAPLSRQIPGTYNFPSPWSEPYIVCATTENTNTQHCICKSHAPSVAFGNISAKILLASKNIPAAHGNAIRTEVLSEKLILLTAASLFFLAIALDINGTNATENATFIDNGTDINISTFPSKIPFCLFASSNVSPKLCNPFITVTVSITFERATTTLPNEIGITYEINFFTIVFLGVIANFSDFSISFHISFLFLL